MLKKTITYTDYNGNERTEDFYFNLSKAELIKMEMTTDGGLQAYIEKITAAKDGKEIMDLFEKVISKAYGEKTADGKHFVKRAELSDAFMQTEAYDILFMELLTDADKAAAFINGIVPSQN